jgi:hypothetical protein
MTADEYRAAKAALIRQDRSRHQQAIDAAVLKRAIARHGSNPKAPNR